MMYDMIGNEIHTQPKAASPMINIVAAATVARSIKGSGGGKIPTPKKPEPKHEKRVANVFSPEAIQGLVNSASRETEPGIWVPARPMGYRSLGFFHSFKAAWMVFTGRWDAVRWHNQ